MIQLSAAGKRYAHKLLFENVDWLITAQDRVGLVGANGTGKFTMLKILGRLETVDYGSLSITRGISAGYLPQDGFSLSGQSVFAEWTGVVGVLLGLVQELGAVDWRSAED